VHHADRHGAAQLNAEIAVGHTVDGVAAGGCKAQLLRRVEAVQRVGRARQCARAKRALGVHAAGGVLQAAQIAQQHPGVGHQLVAEGHRLGALQMGVAGHNVACPLLGLVTKHVDKLFDLALEMLAGGTQVQPDIQRHLVVAAAAGVQPLTRIADAGGQRLLDESMHILGVGVDLQCAAVQILQNRVQTFVNIVHILLGDDTLSAQHGRVDKAALNILLDHPRVKADGRVKIVYAAVNGLAGSALPKLGHK